MAAPTALLHALGRRAQAATTRRTSIYLTDVVALAVAEAMPVVAHLAADERDVRGINDRAQLAAVERILQQRRAEALMARGRRSADPARIDVRGTLTCGRDVRIDVSCVFEGDVKLGDGVTHRPALRAARRARRRRHARSSRSRISTTRRSAPTAASVRMRACARARRSPTTCTSATSSR